MQPLSERCVGRWHGLLTQFGVDPKLLTGRHSPCPVCGGRDRFRFDDKEGRGTWICSKCGAGDGVELVKLKTGWDFRQAAREIEAIVGNVTAQPAKTEQTDGQKRDAMNRLWLASRPVTAGDPVSRYLEARLGLITAPGCLRTAQGVRYQADDIATSHPAMLAMVTDAAARPVNVHRTYLTSDGRKASVASPRRIMPGPLPKGSAVRLTQAEDTLGIAEGIETALAASILFGLPCWAALNATLLAAWVPPEGVRAVMVFADYDASFTGQAAAYALAQRLACQSHVRAEVHCPTTIGQDWADVLQARMNK